MKKKLFIGLIVSGFLVTASFGSDEKNTRASQNEFSLVSSSWAYFQSAAIKNPGIKSLSLPVKRAGSSTHNVGLSFLKSTHSIGGEMEVFLSNRLSLALGAEFMRNSPSDAGFAAGQISTKFFNGQSAFETKASLIPILGTLRFNLPFQKFRAYFGAGAGLYLGKLRINWVSPDFGDERFYARGMAIIPHFNGGLSYDLSKRISVGFDVRYVMGNFNSLTIKECANASMVGQSLNLDDVNTYCAQFPWTLRGLNMGLKVRFRF